MPPRAWARRLGQGCAAPLKTRAVWVSTGPCGCSINRSSRRLFHRPVQPLPSGKCSSRKAALSSLNATGGLENGRRRRDETLDQRVKTGMSAGMAGSAQHCAVMSGTSSLSFRCALKNSAGRGSKITGLVVGGSCQEVIVSVDHSACSLYRKDGFSRLCRAHRIRKIKRPRESRTSPDAHLFSRYLSTGAGNLFGRRHGFTRATPPADGSWMPRCLSELRGTSIVSNPYSSPLPVLSLWVPA